MARPSDARIYGAMALLVVGLAALVWWSVPSETTSVSVVDASSDAISEGKPRSPEIPRPTTANAKFVVLVDQPEAAVRALASATAIVKRLAPRYCGVACDTVAKFIAAPANATVELEVMKGEDLILPAAEMMDTVGASLTTAERSSVPTRPLAIAVHVEGPLGPEQLPARVAFAITAVLADALDGLVWDETCRKIEPAREFDRRTITTPLGAPAFAPQQIVVQLYRSTDGAARLRTLGLIRFGSPDLVIRDADMTLGPMLAGLLNAAAGQIASGTSEGPLTLEVRDAGRAVVDVAPAERTEGDPDNALVELVAPAGDWNAVVRSAFGGIPSAVVAEDDPELAAIATKARAGLPKALQRVASEGGELYVKGPFAIAPDARGDGGAATELLWLASASCDAERCSGVLSNEPSHALAQNLAPGKVTTIRRSAIVDWLYRQSDGGTAGGGSIDVLRERTRRGP